MYYLIEPLCHGNGGWYGQKILKESTSFEELLETRPADFDWEPEYSPYGGYCPINNIRICKSDDANDAIYIFDSLDCIWETA